MTANVKDKLDFLKNQSNIFTANVSLVLKEIFSLYAKTCNNPESLREVTSTLAQNGICEFYIRVWEDFHEEKNIHNHYTDESGIAFNIFVDMKKILWNFSDQFKIVAKKAYETQLVTYLMKDFENTYLSLDNLTNQRKRYLIKGSLGILHNCLRNFPENKTFVRENNGIEMLKAYYKSNYSIIKAKVMIVLGYCVADDENDILLADTSVIKFIVEMLGESLKETKAALAYGLSAIELVDAVNCIASNDKNKKTIMDAGVLPLLLLMLEKNEKDELSSALNCVWTLSFNNNNAQIMKDTEMKGKVESIMHASNYTPILKACHGILFTMDKCRQNLISIQSAKTKGHIMISYQWKYQNVMLNVRDFLQRQKFAVWMDVDKMVGSVLGSMSSAIEKSEVVLIAVSESYKDSRNCRIEGEYAYSQNKHIKFLLVEEGYKADGWLGALLGSQLYYDISKTDNENALVRLERDLKGIDQ